MWVVVVDTNRLWYLAKGCPRAYASGTVQAEWTNQAKDARIFSGPCGSRPDRSNVIHTTWNKRAGQRVCPEKP